MPIYAYKGYDIKSGSPRKGKVESESIRSARQKLKSKEGIMVSDLKEEVASKGDQGTSLFAPKVSMGDLAVMTRQFATLQAAQVPLDESLSALKDQVENPVLHRTLSAVKELVSEGKSLADAMSTFPAIFNRLYINMVKAGESSGSLGLVLERLADFQEYQEQVKSKVFSALSYPALMIGASTLIIVYLFVSVVPKLQKVFESLNVPLPWYTEMLIGFSNFLQEQWLFLMIALAGTFFLLRLWYNSDGGRLFFDRLSLKLPVFGPMILRVNVSKFTKTLSTLLGSGVPIIAALEITRNIIGNKIISDVLVEAKQAVQEGDSLAVSIERSQQFPALVTHMIRTGEKTGELEPMLKHVASAYDAEVERKIDTMISLIEPLMIIVMGGIVVVVVIAMLVPMLSIMNQMH